MKALFDTVSYNCSKLVTEHYSTSFSLATKMLGKSIRADIHNIYGFVRLADEIVDSFHGYDKLYLFNKFEKDLWDALAHKISLNPILNSFQHTFFKYDIPFHLVESFLKSMRMDMGDKVQLNEREYREYIYGSADVVGLMCLKVFVNGNQQEYQKLQQSAMALGSAFQKVNFLRDLKVDYETLNRSYFPNVDLNALDQGNKNRIIAEIEADFRTGYSGIVQLPPQAKFGVYMAYKYYSKLLQKLQKTPPLEIKKRRIRVSNYQKFGLLATSYVNYRLKMV
ncbi:15-cis-phytoene synthase [Arenibacter antarcticus]|uniref:Phytoene/squalene synthase family protein n=1 Tax=Arenibacter antarcticus TaxID=2040469 RepID=A0ABW5VNI6_9FLAO|nr:phytoene/squalene synthase family protein [Arenibacter sp. H213]MCM4168679.1 phytoene synthase [Arenibacter sp. H213]